MPPWYAPTVALERMAAQLHLTIAVLTLRRDLGLPDDLDD